MDPNLTFRYDREGDVLYVDIRPPHAEQESEEIGDEMVARLNPETGAVESLEILFFEARLLRGEPLEVPIAAELRLLSTADR